VLGSAHPKEHPFEALIGLLEEREEDSPYHAAEAHPQVLPGALGLEEMKEDVEGGRVPEVVAQYGECSHEGPAVGMQLDGGQVNLRARPSETGEWEMQFDPFKNGGVEEDEGLSFVEAIISTYWFALSARANRDIGVAFSPKDAPFTVKLIVPVFPYILAKGESGGLNEEFSGSPRV